MSQSAGRAPTAPCERIQARMFAEMLHEELDALRVEAARAEALWQRRCAADGDVDPPHRLVAVRARIDEATRMLEALRRRFKRVP